MKTIVEIKQLTKSYKGINVVKDVSFSIKEREIFGFIGPNGAGKSTTIKMLLNFIYPTSGTGSILGLDCVKDSRLIKKEVGYVSSDVRYYQEMTSMDIFKYTAKFHSLNNDQEVIDDYIKYFEIDGHKKISELSLGNKKKVAIVSALLQNPKLLILDEPTNGLDPMIQHRLFDLLEEKRKAGMTIFLSSHDLHEIEAHCDRAAFIKKGEIIAIENIDKGKNLEKKVMIISEEISKTELSNIGAVKINQKEDCFEFIYQKDINQLLDFLRNKQLTDMTIKPLDLEDKFLSMYE